MSAKVFAMVLDYPFSHTQKAVMLALANQCNDFGQHCFPSFELIQRHTSLGRRTIFDALAQLEEGGFITRVPIRNSQRVEFRIHVAALAQPDLPGLEPEDPAGKRAKPTSAGAAPVREPHQCASRTSAGDSKTSAGAAPTSAGAALYKAPVIYPKAPKREERAPAGAPLPPDWQPTEADIEFARANRPDLDPAVEAAKFRNHWHSTAGVRVDWSAAWRNWILGAYPPKGAAATQQASPGQATASDWRKPPESALENAIRYIRHQYGLGAYGEGVEADAERDRRIAEARSRHTAEPEAETA